MDEPSHPTTATIVFTDMVGSTTLRTELGEERADELRRIHDQLLVTAIEEHRGRVVKGGGDGVMAAFESASDAVAAAVDMQRAVWQHNARPDAIAPIAIRIGLSIGDVTWEHGDCFGTPVVEAARLEAAAEAGQILCSDYVRAMARGRGGHEFTPVGELELKGLPALAACAIAWQPDPGAALFPAVLGLAMRHPLVGRDAELAAAGTILADHAPFRFLWLRGEPGIGKTRLAAELAAEAHAAGSDVLFGHADETLRVPYRPFVETLRGYAAGSEPTLGDMADELTRLVPELRTRFGLDPPTDGDPEAQQLRLFEAVASWLTAAARRRRLVLVLDDLHWATPPTLHLLRHLAEHPAEIGPAIIVTCRPSETPDDLARLVDDLADSGRSLVVNLRGLTAADVAELVGTSRSDLAATVHEQTAGNPFFVTAMLRHLEREADDRDLPADVQTAVRRRISRLDPAAQRALRVSSLLGLEFDLRVVAHACGTTPTDALDQIDQAAHSGLVEEYGVNTFRFAHAVVRRTLADELGPTRRVAAHRVLAEAIEQVHLARLDDHVDALAHHYFQVAQAGECVDEAVQYLVRAGRRAVSTSAPQDALEAFRRALSLLEAATEPSLAVCELRLEVGRLCRKLGEITTAREILGEATAEAERAGWHTLHAELAIEWSMSYSIFGETTTAPVAALEAARASDALPPPLLTRVGLYLAVGYRNTGRSQEAVTLGRQAIAMAEEIGDPEVLCAAAHAVWNVMPEPENAHLRARVVERAVTTGLAAGLDEAASFQTWNLAQTLVQLCDGEPARTSMATFSDHAARWHDPFARWLATVFDAMVAIMEDRLDDGERLATTAESTAGSQLHGPDPSGVLGVQMFTIRREQGRLTEVAPFVEMLARRGSAGAWHPGLAAMYAELGMLDEAAAELHQLLTADGPTFPRDSRWEASTSYLVDVACALGDRRAASVLYDALLPHEAVALSMHGIACYGPAARHLGMLALTMGRVDEAERHLRNSLELCDRLGAPLWRSHTERWLARCAGAS